MIRLKMLFVLIALVAKLCPIMAQADSVCASNSFANYHVNGSAGSTFLWGTQGNGTILSGQGNDSVSIQWPNLPGTYIITVREKNINGCDGILQTLNVVVYQLSSITNAQICPGNNYVLPNGVSVNTPGSYPVILPALNGCDSIVTTILTLNSITNSTTNIAICASQFPYNWNGNNYNTAGNYSVTLNGSSGCDSIATLVLTVNPNPIAPAFAGNNSFLCPGDTIILNPGVYNSYLWQDLSTLPTFAVKEVGTYSVIVSNSAGCIGYAQAIIRYFPNCDDIYFPSAITPNEDGSNDKFGPLGDLLRISNYSLSIFNRYGELVFKSNNPYQKWDGSLKSITYGNISFVWYSEYNFKGNVRKIKKGNLTLIR